MRKILAFLCISAGLASATQIKSVTYNGLIHLSTKSAEEVSGLHVGGEINDKIANKAILNLYKQGYFKDIYIDEKDGAVSVNLTEKPVIAKIDIENIVTNDRKALVEQVLGIKKGQMYDKKGINLAKERIVQFYQAKGFFDTVVEEKTTPMDAGGHSVHVVFNVNRGENIIIRKVNLIGADEKSYSDIEPHVANKEREFMGWMWGRNGGEVQIFQLPGDSEKIREQYMKSGFLDANVSQPYLNAYFDSYEADLTYYIEEGEPYYAAEITIDAPSELELDTEKIISNLKLESGDRINSEWIKRDAQKIEDMVADKGYAYARVYPQTTKNDDHTANIEYKVIPNDKVRVRNITISGNSRTADRVVRRELFLTEGEQYNRTDLKDSKNSLKRTSYFEDVNIKEKRVNEEEVDLEVAVKEARTGSITGGIGYGTHDGILVGGSVSDTNIFGSGYHSTISVDKGKRKTKGKISLTNPRVNDGPYTLGGSIYANDYTWNDYNERNYGFNLTAGRKIGRYTDIYLTYELERSKISGLSKWYEIVGYQNGKSIKSSITPSIVFNNTDDYYLPRHGIIASTSFEKAGLGGNMNFVRNYTGFSWYQGLEDYIGYDLILRYKSGLGYIWGSDDTKKLPINQKLFLGGINSVRGWDTQGITPKEKVCILGEGCKTISTGGKSSFYNSFELSFPMISRVKMRGMVFFDYGMIGEEHSFNTAKRYSTGLGIEWVTPIGPMQLIFAKPLNKKDGDETQVFEFNIGHRF